MKSKRENQRVSINACWHYKKKTDFMSLLTKLKNNEASLTKELKMFMTCETTGNLNTGCLVLLNSCFFKVR